MVDIVIVASAFGPEAVRRAGHRAFVAAAAGAGAAGFEVRSELFASDDDAAAPALAELGRAIAAAGLWSVYSTPATLYADDGGLHHDALAAALAQADALGARFVKFQLAASLRIRARPNSRTRRAARAPACWSRTVSCGGAARSRNSRRCSPRCATQAARRSSA